MVSDPSQVAATTETHPEHQKIPSSALQFWLDRDNFAQMANMVFRRPVADKMVAAFNSVDKRQLLANIRAGALGAIMNPQADVPCEGDFGTAIRAAPDCLEDAITMEDIPKGEGLCVTGRCYTAASLEQELRRQLKYAFPKDLKDPFTMLPWYDKVKDFVDERQLFSDADRQALEREQRGQDEEWAELAELRAEHPYLPLLRLAEDPVLAGNPVLPSEAGILAFFLLCIYVFIS